MANFFGGLFGGVAPSVQQIQDAYAQAQAQQYTITTSNNTNGAGSGAGQYWAPNTGAGSKGVGGIIGPQGMVYQIDEDIAKLQRYAEMCGDDVEMVDLPEGKETDDVKVAILKAADVGKLVKNVGIKVSDTRFAVYREQGE